MVAVVVGNEEGVTLDRDHELGEVAVADDLAELLLGVEHPGGGPAQAHVAVLPVLDVALGVRGRSRSSTRTGSSTAASA